MLRNRIENQRQQRKTETKYNTQQIWTSIFTIWLALFCYGSIVHPLARNRLLLLLLLLYGFLLKRNACRAPRRTKKILRPLLIDMENCLCVSVCCIQH